MEVLSVQNQYPAHFALATGKYLSKTPKPKRKKYPFKKTYKLR